jgi:hypothetical protein
MSFAQTTEVHKKMTRGFAQSNGDEGASHQGESRFWPCKAESLYCEGLLLGVWPTGLPSRPPEVHKEVHPKDQVRVAS